VNFNFFSGPHFPEKNRRLHVSRNAANAAFYAVFLHISAQTPDQFAPVMGKGWNCPRPPAPGSRNKELETGTGNGIGKYQDWKSKPE